MQMKATFKIFLAFIALAMVSCSKQDIQKAEGDLADCAGVFFVEEQKNIGDHMLEKGKDDTYLEFDVRRTNFEEAIEVPYELTVYLIDETVNPDNETFVQSQVFDQSKFQQEILSFGAGQKTAKLKVTFDGIPTGKKFYCILSITDPKYASIYNNNLTSISFSVMMFEWNKIEGYATYRDGVLYDLFNTDGDAPMLENNQVEVYERKDKKYYFRFKGVYSASYIARIAEGEEKYQANKASLDATYASVVDSEAYLYLDATNPDKVYFPAQRTGFSDPSVGDLLIASDVPEVFTSGSNGLYGKRSEDGVITFPKNGLLIGMQGGYYFTNATGKHRIVLPGTSIKDYEITVSASEINSDNLIPVTFDYAKDVRKIRYSIFKGTVNELEMPSKVKLTNESGIELTPAEGELKITKELTPGEDAETDIYTLVACTYGNNASKYEAYSSVEFGYVKPGDEREVELYFGMSTDDQYASEIPGLDYSSKNSFKYWIRGKDLKLASISYYPTSYYTTYEEEIIKDMKLYAVDSRTLKVINGDGISGVIGNTLRAGTSYTMVIYAENAYHSQIFTKELTLSGEPDLMERSYYAYDLNKYEETNGSADINSYAGEWICVSRDLFGSSNNRIIRKHWRADKVELSVEGERIVANGLFPSLKTNPKTKFEYRDGRLYTMENRGATVTVKDSTNIVPSMRFEYTYIPKPVALSESNYSYGSYSTDTELERKDMMVAGFVHEDIIALVDNNTDFRFWAYLMGGYQKSSMGEENLVTYIGEAHGELLLVRKDSPLLNGLKLENEKEDNPVEDLTTFSEKISPSTPDFDHVIRDTNKDENVVLTPFGTQLPFKTYMNQYLK